MAKYKITSPIYFDGVLFPADTIVDTNVLPISGESLVERSWGVPYDGDDEAVCNVEVLRAAMPTPEPIPDPIPEPIPEPVLVPVESEPPKRKRKS